MSLTVEKCLQAWTNSLKQMNAKADIVFFGDSLTYYGDFASVFPDKAVCNLGLRGDTIQGMINRVEQVRMLEPKQVFLMTGINDVAICTVDIFEKKYTNLVHLILQQNNGIRLTTQSLLPVNNRDFIVSCNNEQIKTCNNIIKHLANQNGCIFLDLFSIYVQNGYLDASDTKDGIHLTDAAYQKWMLLLKNETNKLLLND